MTYAEWISLCTSCIVDSVDDKLIETINRCELTARKIAKAKDAMK